MTEVVSVRFKNRGKTYYFAPGDLQIPDDSDVIVETAKGLELAQCARGNHEVEDDCVVQPLRPVVRLATENDRRVAEINKAREKEAFAICQQKIAEHGLDMKLVDVECNFEGNKTMFFFTSDGRVDFRELVKDLASVFRNRIELRQIGVRDEAKMIGGLGICGRPFCCSQFLDDFQPVSTKMAKIQSMSLNPTKISGSCGRLMCCLRYEEDAYEDLIKTVPKAGAFVETPAGYGTVSQVNLLRRSIKVKMDGEGEEVIKAYGADDVAVIPGGRPKPGEELPSLLKDRPKPEPVKEESEEDFWNVPVMVAASPQKAEPPRVPVAEVPVRKSSRRHGRGEKNRAEVRPVSQARPEQQQQPRPQPVQPQQQKAQDQSKPYKAPGKNFRRRNRNKPHPPKPEE